MATETRMARFESGLILFTPGASEALSQDDVLNALVRHFAGDWGKLDDFDRHQNDKAVTNGGRILSSFESQSGTTFWVITEADRSATTFLLPQEY